MFQHSISPKNAQLLGWASTPMPEETPEPAIDVDPRRREDPLALVLVDAATDLSRGLAAHARLRVLPLTIRWPDGRVIDRGRLQRPDALRRLGRERLRDARVEAPDASSLEWRLYPNLALNADCLIVIGGMRDLATPLRAMLAGHAHDIRDMRRARGLPEQLQVHATDGAGLLAGSALQARRLLRWLDGGAPAAWVAQQARTLPAAIRQWIVPGQPADLEASLRRDAMPALDPWLQACGRDLRQLWNRYPVLLQDADGASSTARARTWRAAAGAALEQATEALRAGAGAGGGRDAMLQLSIDGSVRELQAWPEFERLRAEAEAIELRLHVTHRSVAGRIWAPGETLAIALYQPPPPAA